MRRRDKRQDFGEFQCHLLRLQGKKGKGKVEVINSAGVEKMTSNIYICPKIEKPIYETDEGSYVAIYDKHIKQAIKNRKMILIRTNWRGQEISGVYPPKQWKKGKVIEKVYLQPNNPMKLYAGMVLIPKEETAEEKLRKFSINCL